MRQQSTPLKVYLDSQDYYNLYHNEISSDHKKIRIQLLEFKKTGQVCFPLSFLTLFEFVRDYAPTYREDRKARAAFLSEILR